MFKVSILIATISAIIQAAAADEGVCEIGCAAQEVYPPICASDGRVFFNSCEATAYQACDKTLKEIPCAFKGGKSQPFSVGTLECKVEKCPLEETNAPRCLNDGSRWTNDCQIDSVLKCAGLNKLANLSEIACAGSSELPRMTLPLTYTTTIMPVTNVFVEGPSVKNNSIPVVSGGAARTVASLGVAGVSIMLFLL
ncbi:hypothetical protein HDU97_003305 [Phlyctochytrium planicorne]|nr:hypothetical protein HDU97_003305 [Phlyctochytrium planicorne]